MALVQDAYFITQRSTNGRRRGAVGATIRTGIAALFGALALMIPGVAIAGLALLGGVYLVAAGDTNAYRARWRSPCFVHLQLLPLLARGHLVADVVAIIGSIDIVLGEVDR